MFIEDYSVTEDVLTRVFPFMGLVVLIDLFSAFGDRWSGWAQAIAFVASSTIAAGGFALTNLVRGRSPWRLPDDVAAPEIALYVALPIAPVAIGASGNPLVAVMVNTAINLALLGAAFLVTRWGLVPMSIWALGRMLAEIGGVARLALKTLPLVLVFSAFIFLNAEMWQVAHDLTLVGFLGVVVLVVGLGGAFVGASTRRIGLDLENFASWDEVDALCGGTPVGDRGPVDGARGSPDVRLGARGRGNLTLRLFVALSMRILIVAALTTAFYLVFGLLTVRESTVLQWTTVGELVTSRDWVVRVDVAGNTYVFTRQLVVVAAFIGLIAGLQFTVQLVTDSTYREEFTTEMTHDARCALAVRARYLAELDAPGATS